MGNAGSYRQAGNQPQQDARSLLQADLPKFILQARIGNGKFMKTYSVRVDGVPLVVKIYLKLSDEDLQSVANRLSYIWRTLSPSRYPNLLPYEMWIRTADKQQTLRQKNTFSPVYLIRQYVYSNLHDRLSTRPFLNELEKLWLVYQLFKCVEGAHMHRIFHGDIKPENALCTTWNWLMLTDFGPFKPTHIPDDDPTCFQYYFDVMGRSSCYIAPERFYHSSSSNSNNQSSIRSIDNDWDQVSIGGNSNRWNEFAAMDIFSLGCTMAEVSTTICIDGEHYSHDYFRA
jgi:phosphoinositide-3-kinase regulatory subunit 4